MERTFIEGDRTVVMMLGHPVYYEVFRTLPKDTFVRVVSDTKLALLQAPLNSVAMKRADPAEQMKYMLRIDWLNNLSRKIRADKVIYLIADGNLECENEKEAVDKAVGMANMTLEIVDVSVALESKGDRIGTLPWLRVDILGNVMAIYPDTELLQIAPSATDEDRIVPPMKRCFKIGVDQCPKSVSFSPKSVVIAMPFRGEFQDVYKYAIRPTLEDQGFNAWKADENISNIDIMCKICQAVQESGYILANITDWNPNVVFEIGLAYGLGKNVILVKHRKAEVPVDLKGLEYIEYDTLDDLKKNLTLFFKGLSMVG